MKKEKLTLTNIKVESFITQLKDTETETVIGAEETTHLTSLSFTFSCIPQCYYSGNGMDCPDSPRSRVTRCRPTAPLRRTRRCMLSDVMPMED